MTKSKPLSIKKDLIIKARFTGKQISRGYTPHVTYSLKIFPTGKYPIAIRNAADGSGFCHYSTILTFLANWTDIEVVGKN